MFVPKKKKLNPIEEAKKNITEFNTLFVKFVEQLGKIAPNDDDIPKFQAFIDMIVQKNILLFINKFIEYVVPYKEIIEKRDEKFFLDMNYGNIVKHDEGSIMKIFKFKDIWVTITDNDKKYIFDTMIKLNQLVDEYIKKHKAIIDRL